MSCYYNTQQFSTIPNDAYNYWNSSYWLHDPSAYSEQMKSYNVTVYGTFYSTQQNGVLTPVWDLTSIGSYGNNSESDATIYGEKVNSAPSSNGTHNVDWTEYKTSPGGWANTGMIYSVGTVGGQPRLV